MPKLSTLFLSIFIFSVFSLSSRVLLADENNFSLGVWANYSYLPDNDVSKDTWGAIGDEAVILYADGRASEKNWLYSSELRIGPGSFTDSLNNSTGGLYTLHKAWVAWQVNDSDLITVGKSQIPFGWKTVNFWPGDGLLAGFGDQMDVGVKFSGEHKRWRYATAFYLADDWGTSSTDTVDDNGHWGSSTTFRKLRTWVGDLSYEFLDKQTLGISLQSGRLQDLTGIGANKVDGKHQAAALHYQAHFDAYYAKAAYIVMDRDLPSLYRNASSLAESIENQRFAVELGYEQGDWFYYIDVSIAEPDTFASTASRIKAIVPGFRYNYGPGWIYLEYLSQDGSIDRNGQVSEGDFDALYISMDFYL